jgi:hypothetical protein
VSCYTRHLEEFLPPAPSSEDTRALDAAVRVYLEMPEADCPEVWAAVKERRGEPTFVDGVRAGMREND